jgi:hypothetical protein
MGHAIRVPLERCKVNRLFIRLSDQQNPPDSFLDLLTHTRNIPYSTPNLLVNSLNHTTLLFLQLSSLGKRLIAHSASLASPNLNGNFSVSRSWTLFDHCNRYLEYRWE